MYLGSPAVTNAQATDTAGLGWLAWFLHECGGCSVDFEDSLVSYRHYLPSLVLEADGRNV